MAKGRKLTSSQSERFLGSSAYINGQEAINSSSELREDEVWSVIDTDHLSNGNWNSRSASDSNGSFRSYRSSRRPPSTSQHRRQVGGLSLAFDESSKTSTTRVVHQFHGPGGGDDTVAESPHGRHVATSAPLNVPDWSKIYRVESVESMHDSDEDGEPEMVPPHEYLARVYGGSRNHSVFEGVGRTLKGRDLSRVRNAVWSQTGFDG